MRAVCLAVALAILLGVKGCGSDKDAAMPDVTDKQLDKTSSETPAESSQPHAKQVLTAGNSKDLAALLKVSDYCDETVARFVDKYGGGTIEFDGSIKHVATHGDYGSQYDLLVAPGNKGPKSTIGPKFK